ARSCTHLALEGETPAELSTCPAKLQAKRLPSCHTERSEASPKILRSAQNDKGLQDEGPAGSLRRERQAH
ncbi:MAG: hypothetical protein NZ741_13445, partial [Armatimonadetes bacterium]|nr:hypothetical protein [Armatimonadota bacterium]